MFKEATGTTTWSKYFYSVDTIEDNDTANDDTNEGIDGSSDSHSAPGRLLVEDNGAFCFGPKEKFMRSSMLNATLRSGHLYPKQSCMLPVCSTQMTSLCVGYFIPGE